MPNLIDPVYMKEKLVVDIDGNVFSNQKATGVLGVADTGGGIFAWKNPTGKTILINHVVLNVTTKATAACTVDVGATATSATTSSDNLIDGKDVNAATGVFTNAESGGTNGKAIARLAAGGWVTASKATGDAAGTKGTYEIYYQVL